MVEVCAIFCYCLLWLNTRDIDVCIWRMFVFMSVVVTVWGLWESLCQPTVVKDSVCFGHGVLKYVVCSCKGCDGVFGLYCNAWSCRCSCMGSMSVPSCRCCMFVSCVHPVAVLNAALCMTCSLLMSRIQEATIMEEANSRAGLMTAL